MTTPLVYMVLELGMENKQYGISFELATSSQTKLQFQNFLHAFFLIIIFINNSNTWLLDNYIII
jgi:hypothetical protein